MNAVSQGARPEPVATTLLDLVFALERAEIRSEVELAKIAIRLVASRRVKLTGIYRDVDTATLDTAGKPDRLN